MISLKQVLVATDFGDASTAALSYGRELARAFGATLHVVHVVEDISGRMSGLPNFPEVSFDFGRWQREALNVGQEKVGALLSDEDRQTLGANAVVLLARSAAPALLKYAKEHGIDLIVAGTHGRGVVGHLFMGNVAERLVRLAACPVLTVRHPEHEFVLPDALQVVARHA